MIVAVDKAGRFVIPQPLRKKLGLGQVSTMEVEVEDGQLTARPIRPEVILVEKDGRLVATTSEPVAKINHEEFLQAISADREWPRV